MVVVDAEAFRRLPGAVALYRTALARRSGDVGATIAHAQRLLDIIGPDDHLGRAGAAGFLGLAYWTTGDLDRAHGSWSDAVASLERAGNVADVLACTIALADIRIAQGRLGDAMRHYEAGLRLASVTPGPPVRGVADMHVGMSEVLREWNDLDTAMEHLQVSSDLGEGVIDYPGISKTLKDIGFSGDVAVELAHERGFRLTRPLRENWKISREYVRRVLGY